MNIESLWSSRQGTFNLVSKLGKERQGHFADSLSDDGLSDDAVLTTGFSDDGFSDDGFFRRPFFRQQGLFDNRFSNDRFSDDWDYLTTVFPTTGTIRRPFF